MFKRLLTLALAGALSLGLISAAPAVQGSGCMPTTGTISGLTFAQDVNAGIAALISSNSGASAPATDCTALAIKGQVWLDNSVTPNAFRQYDGSSWVTIGFVDASNHVFVPPIGGGTTSVAAAATTDLGVLPNAAVTVTGATTIVSFGSSAVVGTIHVLTFSGSLTLTYNAASMILPGAANIVTQAGDTAFVIYLGSGNWKVLSYHPISSSPLVAAYALRGNPTGSAANASDILIASLTLKSTLVGTDLFMIADSAASNALKRAPLSELQAVMGLALPIIAANGGTGVVSPTAKTVPVNQGASPQTNVALVQGQCLTADGSGNPVATAGCRVLLNTLNPSNVASVSDTTSFTSAFNDYEIVLENVLPVTNSVDCQLELQSGGTFQTTSYNGTILSATSGGTTANAQTTSIRPAINVSNSGAGISGKLTLFNPSQTTSPKNLTGMTINSNVVNLISGSWTGGNTAITGIQVNFSSGNFSGTIKIYGLK